MQSELVGNAMTHDQPELSVIVPVYNGELFLDRCLEALSRSSFRHFECIVVDDGSTDSSAATARKHGATVLSLDERGGPARARNRGVAAAGGAIVVFLDADVCVHAETLGRIDAYFRDHPAVDAVMGSYDDEPAAPGLVSQYKNLSHHFVHQRSRAEAWTFWAGCGAIRKPAFDAVGGFDEGYTRPCIEDIELGARLHARGNAVHMVHTIQVKHLKRWTLANLVRTDLFDRGVPWFALILKQGSMPSDLNVTIAHRLNIVLVYAVLLLMAAAAWKASGILAPLPEAETLLSVAAALVGVIVAIDWSLYRFFARRRGLLFALATIPLQCLYYGYCGLAVVLGLIEHWRGRWAVGG